MPMIEPDKEALAYQRRIRSGLCSWSDAVRELGYDPDALLQEIAADNKNSTTSGSCSTPTRVKMTQAGQVQSSHAATAPSTDGGATNG
jgi:capsid protein